MNLRKTAFFFFDWIKGGSVKNHLKVLQEVLLNSSFEELKSYQEMQWQYLRHHVQQTVPFYQKIQGESLRDFPVINKSSTKEIQDLFFSTKFKRDKLAFQQTSGSTGTPFRVYQNSQKRKIHQAGNIFFNELAEFHLGDRLYYFRIWDKLVQKSKRTFFFQNVVQIDSSDLSCEGLNRNFYSLLKKEKYKATLLAYSSTFEGMSVCLKEEFKSDKVKSIITMSETLPIGSRKQLEAFFNCKVYSRYSNMENGFIAQETSFETGYLVNEADYIVECLDLNSDTPVSFGELGRIVITDLHNFAMPLIRYDTGDLGVFGLKKVNGHDRLFIEKVEGRRVDFIYDENDNLISPHVITNTMWRYNSIKQFQFIQIGKGNYRLKLNGNPFNETEEIQLISDIKSYLGKNIKVELQYVDEIPLLSSGKRKKIVNEYKIP